MIPRFCLYGFLKNQRYFEPFLILAFLDKGLTYLDIGTLVGFREMAILVMEIPSGAIADVFGRRRSVMLSFVSYILSFILFALSTSMVWLLAAMLFFAFGDAFRTGTHKAMIFEWLRQEGRLQDRTRVYGFTRSWSKIGSATSALLAGALVFLSGNYSLIFWLSTIPYLLNLVNFMGYPPTLEGSQVQHSGVGAAVRMTGRALQEAATRPRLRHLFLDSMLLEGMFKITKDYLQPVVRSLAVGLPVLVGAHLAGREISLDQRAAVLIGLVFFIYFLLMGLSSRNAHHLVGMVGGEDSLVRLAWVMNLMVFLLMAAAMKSEQIWLVVVCFLVLGMIQNVFRPAQISRFNQASDPDMSATILSVESQSKSLAAAVMAPLLGWLVDGGRTSGHSGVERFWPVAVLGIVISAAMLLVWLGRKRSRVQGFTNPGQ